MTLAFLKFGGTFIFRPQRQVRKTKPLTLRIISPIWCVCFSRRSFFLVFSPAWRKAISSLVRAEGGITVFVFVISLKELE